MFWAWSASWRVWEPWNSVEGVDYVLDLECELLECELGCDKFGFSLM